MHTLKVGELYVAHKNRWPEGCEYNYLDDGHHLRLFFNSPSQAEIQAVKKETVDFALTVERDIIFLLFKFSNSIPWSDAPYNWHLVPKERQGLPDLDLTEEQRQICSIILVNATDGILKAIRQVSFSHDFTIALHKAIREQGDRPWPGHAAYNQQLSTVYSKCNSEQLVKRAIARCKGGD